MAIGGASATLLVKVVTDAKDASKGLDDAAGSVDKFKSGMKVAGVAAAAAGGAILAFGISAANAAAEDAQGQAILAQALKNSTGARADDVAGVEDWISAQSRATGVADDQLRPALATLARATGDVATSQAALTLAMDVSAATGDDLGSVSDALAKAYAGNTTSLGKLVPGLDKTTLASKDMVKITAELAKLTGGSAAAAADTAAGKQQILANSMSETKEAIGAQLLPALAALLSVFQRVVDFIASNTQVFIVIAGVIGVVAAAILVLNVAMTIHTAVTYAMNAAWLASPITWIILGIVALVAVIVIIATKTTWFQDIWNASFAAVKKAIQVTFNWIADNWPLLLAILTGPIGLAVLFIVSHLDQITSAARTVWSFLSGAFTTVWSAISSAATSALNAILTPIHAVISAFQTLIGWAQKVIDAISHIKIPDLPGPLAKLTPWSATPAPPAGPAARGMSAGGRSSGSGGITINVQVSPLSNPTEVGRAVAGSLRSFVAAGGRLPVNP